MSAGVTDLVAEPARTKSDCKVALVAIAIFAVLSIGAAVTSEGFLEADAGTHYLYARFALSEWHYLTNVWGRPLCTGIYALPAYGFGRIGVRLTSLMLAVGCALVAWNIARNLGWRRPVLALVFTLAQPLVFLHSFSELTELPFALVIGLAFLAFVRRQWFVMALLIGLSPLGRPEGFGFLLLGALALVLNRRAWWLSVLLVPLVAWNYAGWVVFGRTGPWWGWLASQWPYAGSSLYPSGSIFHFVALLPVVTSPFLFPATLVGIALSLRTIGKFNSSPRREPCVYDPTPERARPSPMYTWERAVHVPQHEQGFSQSAPLPSPPPTSTRGEGTGADRARLAHRRLSVALVALIPLSILSVHSALYFLGKMASNGELRYLLVVAPFWGLLSAAGYAWAFERFQWRHLMRWASLACLAPVLVNVIYKTVPIDYEQTWKEARRMSDWYRASSLRTGHPYFTSSHTGLYYFLDVSPSDQTKIRLWEKQTVQELPPGTIVFWDETFALLNADANRKISIQEIESAGWKRVVDASLPDLSKWRVYVSPAPEPASNEHALDEPRTK